MEACRLVLENKELMILAGWLCHAALEAWFGSTDKTQAGSLPAFLLLIARKALEKFKNKES